MSKIVSYYDRKSLSQLLLSKITIQSPPVPVVALAKGWGFTVLKGDISDESILTYAIIEPDKKMDKKIVLSHNTTSFEQRFFICYLLLKYLNRNKENPFLEIIHRLDILDNRIYEEVINVLLPDILLKREEEFNLEDKMYLCEKYQVYEHIVKQKEMKWRK